MGIHLLYFGSFHCREYNCAKPPGSGINLFIDRVRHINDSCLIRIKHRILYCSNHPEHLLPHTDILANGIFFSEKHIHHIFTYQYHFSSFINIQGIQHSTMLHLQQFYQEVIRIYPSHLKPAILRAGIDSVPTPRFGRQMGYLGYS